MTQESDSNADPGGWRPRPLQFGLGSLLLFVIISAGYMQFTTGIGAGIGFAVFAIAFFGVMLLVFELARTSGREFLVVRETASDAEAHLCRQFLEEHGISALVLEDQQALPCLMSKGPQVLVRAADVKRAAELLAEQFPRWEPDGGA
jgi:hypothetical protein